MVSNHKLTTVLKGRTIKEARTADGVLTVRFDDGSTMTVKTASGDAPQVGENVGAAGPVEAVRQTGTLLRLDFNDGTVLDVPTAEVTSSVMVRDKNHALEYAD